MQKVLARANGLSDQSRSSGRAKIAGAATAAALLLALNVPSAAMAQTTLSNGNFEAPAHPGYLTIQVGGNIGAWKVTAGSVDHGTGPGQTGCQSSGGQCVDLNGTAKGTITQQINTCQPRFRMNFYMARHHLLTGEEATLTASATGTPPKLHKHSPPTAPATWVAQFYDFVGTPGPITITFASTTNGKNPAAGPQIDNVTIVALPCELRP